MLEGEKRGQSPKILQKLGNSGETGTAPGDLIKDLRSAAPFVELP